MRFLKGGHTFPVPKYENVRLRHQSQIGLRPLRIESKQGGVRHTISPDGRTSFLSASNKGFFSASKKGVLV